VSDADPAKPEDEREEPEVLRAKYHDYCSSQLADFLLYLSPDEIYLLAQRATRNTPQDMEDVSYARMVAVATDWLASQVVLPPFEVWLEDYREHPDVYEEYLMGLWEADAKPASDIH
jgi:hypothetical protein